MNFKKFFECETGRKYKGPPNTSISDHMNLIADTFADYVDEIVKRKVDNPLYIVRANDPAYTGDPTYTKDPAYTGDPAYAARTVHQKSHVYTRPSYEIGSGRDVVQDPPVVGGEPQECGSPLPDLMCGNCNCWKKTREYCG